MSRSRKKRADFVSLNDELTKRVVEELNSAGTHEAVLAEAPPGAGKSTLTASVAEAITSQEQDLTLPVVTQTNEQADDLVRSLVHRFPNLIVARLVASGGPSASIAELAGKSLLIGTQSDHTSMAQARVVVGTARKWQYERSRMQENRLLKTFPFALIDEAYQMRSDMLLGIADLYDTLFCVGDPGQLDPFTTVDDSLWKGCRTRRPVGRWGPCVSSIRNWTRSSYLPPGVYRRALQASSLRRSTPLAVSTLAQIKETAEWILVA